MSQRRLRWLIMLGVSLGGCVRQKYVVTPRSIHEQVSTLRAKGTATVKTEPSGTARISADTVFEVRFPSKASKWIRWAMRDRFERFPISELIANCSDVPPFREDKFRRNPPCLLQETSSRGWVVDSRLRPDWEKWKIAGVTTLGAGLMGGMGYCASKCDGTGRTISIVGLAAFVVASLPLLALTR